MQVYKFYEVLNDLFSYFLLADIDVLKRFQLHNHLPNDLATEFTKNATGDKVVLDGVMIPLSQIENYPYTIIFNLGNNVELLKPSNDLQISQKNYVLNVESGRIYLFTWRALQNFDSEHLNQLIKLKPTIPLENGWYQVDIYAGQTWQTFENNDAPTFEPTIEFVLKKRTHKPVCQADIFTAYHINSNNY